MKGRRHEPIRFFLVHLRYIPCGDSLTTGRAENRSVVLREVDHTVNDAVIVHLDKIALADFW